MPESLKHWKAKLALERILLLNGWKIMYRDGDISYLAKTERGDREYWPDILAYKYEKGDPQPPSSPVCFEVDGPKGHSTKRDIDKMQMRDDYLLREEKIRTVRLKTDDLTGKKKQPTDLILQEINWQLCLI